MDTTSTVCHVVAVPYPGRGHVNPMINLCKLLASKKEDVRITIVVTEEWLGFIGSNLKPHNIGFSTIPNVLPSELVRAANYPDFYEAVMTKMEAPFEQLLDQIQPPATAIIANTELLWTIPAARLRNIPVASLWTASASVFSTKCEFPFPVYPIGPAIPYLQLEYDSNVISVSTSDNDFDYLKWLDSQPKASVLYISLGSFLSVSSTQMDEIAAGLQYSGIRFIWVARGESSRLKESCGDMELVVPWCEQLKVLCHCSVGGFWTHCGWNSTLEAAFAGVPMLTFPLFLDQVPNSSQIVEDWRIGKRVREVQGDQILMTREEVAETA